MSTKKKILIAIVGVEAVVIAAVIVFLFYINSDTVQINRQLKLAQRYLLEEDYEQAIAAFEVAIGIDPKNAEAYLGLAEAYAATDDVENVVKILERGSKRTDSEEIQKMLKKHTEEIEQKELAAQRAEEAAQEAADAASQQEAAESKPSEQETLNTEFVTPDNKVKDEGELFREYLTTVLIPANGIFASTQRATMYSPDDIWLDPRGIMDATLLDFDKDGKLEMLVCYTMQTTFSDTDYYINMDIYEIADGKVVLSSGAPFIAYHEYRQKDDYNVQVILSENEWAGKTFAVNVVYANDKYYIVCKENRLYSCFGDGYASDDWAMTYENGKLQYAFSYTQTQGGSSDFEYVGYEFVNGQCINSELYYSEIEESPFDDMGVARADFFKKQGIIMDDSGNLLSNASDITRIFEYRNKLINVNFGDAYQYYTVGEFEASLTAYGENLAK